MPETTKTPAADAAAIETARAEAQAAERTRISQITSALGGECFATVRQDAIDKGYSLVEAKAAAFDAATQQIADLQGQVKAGSDKLAAIAASGIKPVEQGAADDQAKAQEEADQAQKAQADQAGAFDAKVAEAVKAGKSKAAAMADVAAAEPGLHQAWLDRANAPKP